MWRALTASFGVGFLMVSPAQAADEDVVEQINAGKAFYVEGDLARALTEFEFALDAVRTEFSNLFMGTLPEPPILWSADEPALENAASLFGGGVMVTRLYREEKGEGQITVELVVDNPMVQAFSAVIGNPIMVANDPGIRRIRFDDKVALLNWKDEEGMGELSLSMGGRVLAKLVGRNLEDESVLLNLMKRWDLDAVTKIAGL
jgi:hypothetical protein